jgi:hypothetical protein
MRTTGGRPRKYMSRSACSQGAVLASLTSRISCRRCAGVRSSTLQTVRKSDDHISSAKQMMTEARGRRAGYRALLHSGGRKSPSGRRSGIWLLLCALNAYLTGRRSIRQVGGKKKKETRAQRCLHRLTSSGSRQSFPPPSPSPGGRPAALSSLFASSLWLQKSLNEKTAQLRLLFSLSLSPFPLAETTVPVGMGASS